jgi:hypothetical protein
MRVDREADMEECQEEALQTTGQAGKGINLQTKVHKKILPRVLISHLVAPAN